MANVRLAKQFFIDGVTYEAGDQQVAQEHLDRLPKTAVRLDGRKAAKREDPEAGEALKSYRFCPKEFYDDDQSRKVDREDVLAMAFKVYQDETGKGVAGWNRLSETQRRSRIEKASRVHFGEKPGPFR